MMKITIILRRIKWRKDERTSGNRSRNSWRRTRKKEEQIGRKYNKINVTIVTFEMKLGGSKN